MDELNKPDFDDVIEYGFDFGEAKGNTLREKAGNMIQTIKHVTGSAGKLHMIIGGAELIALLEIVDGFVPLPETREGSFFLAGFHKELDAGLYKDVLAEVGRLLLVCEKTPIMLKVRNFV